MPSPSENRAVDIVLAAFPGSVVITPDRTKPMAKAPVEEDKGQTIAELVEENTKTKIKSPKRRKKRSPGPGQEHLL